MSNTTSRPEPELSAERRDLLEVLAMHRQLLRQTAAGLTDDGRLMVSHAGSTVIVAAGDVIHATI